MSLSLVTRQHYGYHRNMDVEPSIAALGAMIAVPARANILSALFDGRALTASELAFAAGVTAQTTSSHLFKLVDAGLLVVEQSGRHRYYRLSSPAVAEALEPLAHISPHRPTPARGRPRALEQLREARLCYDHLAGRLGVAVTEAMISRGLLVLLGRDFDLSTPGATFCLDLGIDVAAVRAQRRVFARQCLDWSERKLHLSGALGAAIAKSFFDLKWLQRTERARGLVLTDAGRIALKDQIGLQY